MSRWFRLDDDVVNDPKVQCLPGDLFKAWINLLCLTSKGGGNLPDMGGIAFGLRVNETKAAAIIETLRAANLVDEDETGMRPHNWNGRQHRSDVSTERVKRFRERHVKRDETVSETPPDTEQNRAESEQKDSGAVAKATRPAHADDFEEFWQAYPSRGKNANPKTPARKAFLAAIKAGADPKALIAAVKAGQGTNAHRTGTEFVPRATTWLSERRWTDTPTADVVQLKPGQFHAMLDSPQYRAWQIEKRKTMPGWAALDGRGGWTFDSEWPPGYDEHGMPKFLERKAETS